MKCYLFKTKLALERKLHLSHRSLSL